MLGSIGVSGKMMMPMKAALTWGHPMMSPPLTSTRTNVLQMRATVKGGVVDAMMDPGNPSKDRGIGRQGRRLKRGRGGGCNNGAAGIDQGGGGGGGLQWLATRAFLVKYKKY
jgi:hypothetical protein